MNNHEIVDLVSPNDEVIGQEDRNVVYDKKMSCFRVINGFICNSQKKLWIPRRHSEKKLFHLHLDASVGGHVLANETYEQAFIRETKEELNISLNPGGYEKVARLTPHENNTSAFMWVYIIKSDQVPPYNANDFIEYYWLTIEEFFKKLKEGDRAKSDLVPILTVLREKL